LGLGLFLLVIKVELGIGEVEGLGYYDFMAYIGVPFFNIGGVPGLDLLAERCGIDEDSHVLDVGCGTGGNSAYLVERYGCRVTGVDISEVMIARAKERREGHPRGDRMRFMVGDAYGLGFPDESFDVVLTVFVSQFLDLEQAFPEFSRVLVQGGCLGVNEMYRLGDVPEMLVDRVDEADPLTTYLSINTSSKKLRQVKNNPVVALYYSVPDEYRGVMLRGKAVIHTDFELKQKLWVDDWTSYYPRGVRDPDFTLLMVRPDWVKSWYRGVHEMMV